MDQSDIDGKDEAIVEIESDEEIEDFVKNPGNIHIIGMYFPARPGVRLFGVKLEYSHFTPGTPKNKEFFFRIFNWQGIVWSVISIPKESIDLARKVAGEAGLKMVEGFPVILAGRAMDPFPFFNKNTFGLENVSGHKIYVSSQEERRMMLQEEKKEMEAIISKA